MAKRKPREYSADEFRVLEGKLKAHAERLAVQVVLKEITADEAHRVRDVAQMLGSTLYALSNFDLIYRVVEREGTSPCRFFDFDRCGLDENGDPIPDNA